MRLLVTLLSLLLLAGAAAQASLPPGFAGQVEAVRPAAENLYLDLHRNPELGFREFETAKKTGRTHAFAGL